ncbi:MAG: hypothetical protein AAF518_27285 [Spirochaetota bacterium]
MKNRKNDAIDVFHAGVELPAYGFGLRFGPLALGFLFIGGETEMGAKDKGEGWGMRGGYLGKYKSQQLIFGLLGGERFHSLELVLDEKQKPSFDKHGLPELKSSRDMLKSHNMRYLTFYDDPPFERRKRKKERVRRHYIEEFEKNNPDSLALQYIPPEELKPYGYPKTFLYQFDFVLGAGVAVRGGFNIAEFTDLLLGTLGADILEDDLDQSEEE